MTPTNLFGETLEAPPFSLHRGDARQVLTGIPDESIDAIVCDPPYGLSKEPDVAEVLRHWIAGDDYTHTGGGFMGKTWDSFVPGPSVWKECLRVLKPGGHLLAFAGSRTQDLMGMSIRLAGLEMRDTLTWMYGSGFPKSMDVSKAVDKAAGAEREVLHSYERKGRSGGILGTETDITRDITAPATPEAEQWSGWGTALKPAYEPIIMARKPLRVGDKKATVAANVLEHGTGALNIDATRIGYTSESDKASATPQGAVTSHSSNSIGAKPDIGQSEGRIEFERPEQKGRWPANVLLTHHEDCIEVGTRKVKTGTAVKRNLPDGGASQSIDFKARSQRSADETYANPDGAETIPAFDCHDDCPVRLLDEQSGNRPGFAGGGTKGAGFRSEYVGGDRPDSDLPAAYYGDKGGASRFFYSSKTSKKERNAGLPEGKVNNHPTVKPIEVMRWLVKLVTPPDGTVLDPFMGSGSTGCAAVGLGFGFIGIDRDDTDTYLAIAEARIQHHLEEA